LNPANSSLIVVAGPTGSGKSDLALALARHFRGEIVNCDSVQVYRGLDIGSAKTPAAEREGVPHHLIDVADPSEDLTAGAYAELARAALADITARRRLPIIAGGTGFYLRSLLDGLSPAPARDPDLRARLIKVGARRPTTIHRLLQRRDPAAALRIHPNDRQKLIRALELSAAAGPPRSRLPLTGYSVLKIGLNPERSELYRRLNLRSAAMFQNGLLAETQALLDTGLNATAKSLQTLGYKQAVQVLTQGVPLADAIGDCQTKTRQYAKRQLTWFRRESNINWLEGFGSSREIQAAAAQLVSAFLKSIFPDA
jgi:tRNA dimethylallyltransferase